MGSVSIGSNNYDIYGTLAGADAYLAAKLSGTTWIGSTSDTRSRALVEGTRLLRAYLLSLGYDLDPASAVDLAIEEANYELAFALVVDPTIADQTNAGNNNKRLKAGSAEIEYFRPVRGGRFPSQVQAILNGWLAEQGGSSAGGGAFASGTCERSTLDSDDYGLAEGY